MKKKYEQSAASRSNANSSEHSDLSGRDRRQSLLHLEKFNLDWELRSLIAGFLLSVCLVCVSIAATVAHDRAERVRTAEATIESEAALVAAYSRFLEAETHRVRTAVAAPSLKPAANDAVSLAATSHRDLSQEANAFLSLDLSDIQDAKNQGLERTCLAQAIYYEARSEARVGQLAVADVVLNRVASRAYPNSICEVVFQGAERRTGCQFSFTCDGSMKAGVNERLWKRADDLAGAILAGVHKPITRDATHYHASYVNPPWASKLAPTASIGAHRFYKFPSRRQRRFVERNALANAKLAATRPSADTMN
ncbi:MAG: cell wall hydrolase [Pseudomonadota bacterium]